MQERNGIYEKTNCDYFLVLLLAGCSAPEKSNSTDEVYYFGDYVTVEGINIWEHQYIDTKWDELDNPVDVSDLDIWKEPISVDTNEATIALGRAIIEELHGKERFREHDFGAIHHAIENNAWYFFHSRPLTYGDYLYIVVDGDNGSLLGAFITH